MIHEVIERTPLLNFGASSASVLPSILSHDPAHSPYSCIEKLERRFTLSHRFTDS